ncbi:MAG TPA: regulatory iron-sulfur-containing complex subunit RicT [Candidatus Binatia bacterium]|nr:regulatory iron-sulfur-containing complex subunit RicT [Candidatus Binatia bacterium]
MDERLPENIESALRVVGVKFKVAGAIYDFDAGAADVAVGDSVVVEAERGMALATVATPPRRWSPEPASARPFRVLRKADDRDFARDDENRRHEREAHHVLRELIHARRLLMKLVRVEYSFDGSKATVYFFSENRVDFRDLVREVAQRLRVRVEMKQIGARDETKLVGALGPCGRELCCSSWLREFHAISVKMAKEQDLSLSPSKLAGMCGRLKCCLRYEYETYLELRRALPAVGRRVTCVKGDGVVVKQLPIRESVVVRRDEDGVEVEATLEDLVEKKEP